MGEVLIAGLASLLISIFLSPMFFAMLRRREICQIIWSEGPEEHHEKARTTKMLGIFILTAISNPFHLTHDYTCPAIGV